MLQFVVMGYKHVIQRNDFHVSIKDTGDTVSWHDALSSTSDPLSITSLMSALDMILKVSGPCPKFVSLICLLDVIPRQSPGVMNQSPT